ncbi:MAG: hypothetical protein M3Y89_08930 [Actinomycetota bacterium]|nr:hypothetical protein [Actinomycetota bacterium]
MTGAALALSLGCGLLVAAAPVAEAAGAPGCTASAPVGSLVLAELRALKPTESLTATDGHGLWAGVRFDGGTTFQVISWKAGRTTVLDSFNYANVSYDDLRSVRVVGVSSAGAVVASVQRTDAWVEANRRIGVRYQNGHRTVLKALPGWQSVDPTGVSPDGRISGDIRRQADGGGQVEQWSATGAVSTVAANHAGSSAIDALGDVGYIYQNNYDEFSLVRLANGRTLHLGGDVSEDPSTSQVAGGSGPYLYGRVENGAVVRWAMTGASALPAGATVPMSSAQPLNWFTGAGPDGTLVGQNLSGRDLTDRGARLLRDSVGDFHPMPAEFQASYQDHRPVGIAPDGTLAYTGTDGLVRFYKCTVNPAAHNPRGGLDTAVNIAGTVRITGAAADRDDYNSPLYIEIYDVTYGRRLVAKLITDRPSAGLDKALHISGDHGFAAVIRTTRGTHRYCAYAVNIGPGNANTTLGCLTLADHGGPVG